MEKIETLSTIRGRIFLQKLFFQIRFEKQYSGFSSLFICWKICCYEKEISKFVKSDAQIIHHLGFWRGTSLWMEEIVNRYFFSTINSFVYLGAAVLLVLIGVRRYSAKVSEEMVIGGLVLEATMLVTMFVVMLFSPNEDLVEHQQGIDKENEKEANKIEENLLEFSEKDELLTEIGEISRDFAAVVVKMEELTDTVDKINSNQSRLVTNLEKLTESLANAVSPNPEMIEKMKETNLSLNELQNSIKTLAETANKINDEQIKFEIKKQVEEYLNKGFK